MSPIRPIALVFACALSLAPRAYAQTPPPPPPTPPVQQQGDPVRIEEHVVVSATKVEQQLVNAPATITVIGARALDVAASQSYGELLRNVPGVNITQVSARDVNITPRGSTSTLSTNQLAVLDGRSLYQDFFGFVMWDFMPVNLNELKRIEVIRGPASAIWGANAVSGVINVITKTPREMLGTSVAVGAGTFDRADEDAGTLWYLNGTHAGVISERASFKVSAGYYTQDPFARPTGLIPNGGTTQYPEFTNQGTSQPKVDGRLDYSLENGSYMTFSGGYAGTEGIMHSGIGPFDIESGSWMGYGKANFTRNAFRLQAFFNTLDGDATQLLTRGPGGAPITFLFNTRTIDVEAGNVTTLGQRNVLTYGGNLRHNTFDLSIAPDADARTEGGFYAQDEIFLHDRIRVVLGARLDKFTSIDGVVVSPRAAVVVKPVPDQSIRVSYNRAFRAPSAINNHIDLTITEPLVIPAQVHPLLAGKVYFVPIAVTGNEDLQEERLDAFEVGYTGIFGRTTVSAAWYLNKFKDQILFTQTGEHPLSTPPPGFANVVTSSGLPAFTAPLFWGGIQNVAHFPSTFTYRNFGEMTQKGIELGVDTAVTDRVNVYANYSWQGEPEPEDFDISELNIPPEHRVNAGFNFNINRVLGSLGVSYVGEAFWQDVLDARFHGTTDAYTLVNGSVGIRFGARDRFQVMLKGTNLTNEDIQQHIFGDIIKRQLAGELRINF